MNKHYIKRSNLPPRLPFVATLFWWMFLDYTSAPGWVYGAVGVMLLIVWSAFFHEIWNKEPRDLFKDGS